MCYQIIQPKSLFISALFLFCIVVGSARAESLFEQYSSKHADELSAETRNMGKELKNYFSADNIQQHQKQIDFSAYRSNFKKIVLYAVNLATYSEYERDLQFARDKEIFQGLPTELKNAKGDKAQQQRRNFMDKKYQRMQQNVAEEVATYTDMLLLALDTCETFSRQDLSGILDDSNYVDEMRDFLHGDEIHRYQQRQSQLGKRWPELNQRIAIQIALWQVAAVKPNAPIIDTKIIEAL